MENGTITPIIQTHTFNVGPYLPFTRGYAPFLISNSFNGSERIIFTSLDSAFPISHQLNEYSHGKWSLGDQERVETATAGPLESGRYRFIIHRIHTQREEFIFRYEPYFIGCSDGIVFHKSHMRYRIEWSPPQGADNFWVFLFPVESKNFLEDLIPITENQFKGTQADIDPLKIPSGRYKCAVRTNQMWKHPSVAGFLSESWSISDLAIHVP